MGLPLLGGLAGGSGTMAGAGWLTRILTSLNKGFLKQLLLGAGIQLAFTGGGIALFTTMMDRFRDVTTGLPPTALMFAHLMGLDVGLSIVIGAMMTRFGLQSLNVNFRKGGQLKLF